MLRSLGFWKFVSLLLFAIASVEFCFLTGLFELPKQKSSALAPKDDGFEAFQSIAFAREFSEKFQTFDSQGFRSTQTATAFLLDEKLRNERFSEIERLAEKIERREVRQQAKLMRLVKLGDQPDHFRADVLVDLREGAGLRPTQSQFWTRLDFTLERTERTAQNAWGFRISSLRQDVISSAAPEGLDGGTAPIFALRPGVATLVRFPCLIENVELPKGTSVRVKLTTLDISELQMKTEVPLMGEQTIRAVCRDRSFTMKVADEVGGGAQELIVLKTMTMENSVAILKTSGGSPKKRKKTGVEKSIEDQLGFVVEEE